MDWLTNIFSGGVDKVVDSVTSGLDNLFTSDEERLQLKNALQGAMNEYNLDIEKQAVLHEQEITKRWQADSEHFITRLVRPVSYIFILFLLGVIVLADGNIGEFAINKDYIPLIQTLLMTMTVAYFGGRTYEKATKIKHK